jgi:hypothetical protein
MRIGRPLCPQKAGRQTELKNATGGQDEHQTARDFWDEDRQQVVGFPD